MRLFIDDIRTPVDDDWVVARDSEKAISVLKMCRENGETLHWVSYDHDLGRSDTIRDVLLWQGYHSFYPEVASVHSSNPVGQKWIRDALEHDTDQVIPIVAAPEYIV